MINFPDKTLIKHIDIDYQKLSGKPLPSPKNLTDRSWWLHHEAPYSILAHNTDIDPYFIYANQYALECFEYLREEISRLPSRLSTPVSEQQKRQLLLDELTNKGIVHGYSGVRITRTGKSFNIYNGAIWQLKDSDGKLWGQGALFWLSPNGSEHNFDV
ncbi:MEKHLA domain-containing protein [Shewanella sp. SM34]|uniref:MEKHLA domain-containing protein n=1 Tax=unclassified Shewanella TaxID=196818 RepID=UPI0021D811F6|nr:MULTISPECIES: MEKHLA domain-containing protein [unclassified Shewanella]MCU8059120.1 MEKHLA domain-containing protein [Shewanella sp. SM35]MCU8068037.1 MEKHLA domain-containing protein [Shewanella sp. SM34]MCU8076908.1 MEKHLA domain-containing protein [Shewanella sp. SM29]MCU8085761.1 MEKHLA domain-containing protein [Shewanella sp. SM23]